METARTLILMASTITAGLISGLFYAFTVAVMPGLARSTDGTTVETMQNINKAILNGWFMLAYLGAPLFITTALVLHATDPDTRNAVPPLAAALATCLAAMVITARINIPLNNALEEAGPPNSTPTPPPPTPPAPPTKLPGTTPTPGAPSSPPSPSPSSPTPSPSTKPFPADHLVAQMRMAARQRRVREMVAAFDTRGVSPLHDQRLGTDAGRPSYRRSRAAAIIPSNAGTSPDCPRVRRNVTAGRGRLPRGG